MRNIVVGIVIGIVIGMAFGGTVIAPNLPKPENLTATVEEEAEKISPLQVETLRGTSLRMAASSAAELPLFGTQAERLDREISKVSGGNLELRYHPPGALVPTDAVLNAVTEGTIDAAFGPPDLWADMVPALHIFAGAPFGPAPREFLSWVFEGGGLERLNDSFNELNVHGQPCGFVGPSLAGWFRNEINSAADLTDLRIAAPPLPAKVLIKAGAKAQVLVGADAFIALENGELDGASFSVPAVDLKLGIHKHARHGYMPGWQRQASLLTLIINSDRWAALTSTEKFRIESVCRDNVRYGLVRSEAIQFDALKSLQKDGAILHRLPRDVLGALENAWNEVAKEEASANKGFRRTWRSLNAFRRDHKIWNDLGYIQR